MAGDAQSRMRQLVSIAEARTLRAADAVTIAQRAAALASIALDHAQSALAQALAETETARLEFAAHPASEQIRMWVSHCDRLARERQDNVETANAALNDAERAVAQAIKAWQRQQLRQEHIETHAGKLRRDAMRNQERKREDEAQGSGKATTMWATAL